MGSRVNCFALLLGYALTGCASEMAEGASDVGSAEQSLVSGAGEATIVVQSDWGSGYCADVTVANKGTSDITNWTVGLKVPAASINNLWNGNRSGTTVTPVANSNNRIAKGGKVTFGFCANVTGSGSHAPSVATLSVVGGGDGGSGGSGGGTGGISPGVLVGSATLMGSQISSTRVSRDGKEYKVMGNLWGGSGNQTLTYLGNTFTVTTQTATLGGDVPVSYPNAYIGTRQISNGTTANSGMPISVNKIVSIKSGWQNNAKTLGNAGGKFNASYDLWFNDPSASGEPSGGYLTVWFWSPSGTQPIGKLVDSVNIAGQTWNIWYGNSAQNGKPCVSYVSPAGITALEFDLSSFIRDAVSHGYVKNVWQLTTIHAGFEIWSGGKGLKSEAFYADVL